MKIELTQEMQDVLLRGVSDNGLQNMGLEIGLRALLDVVERDYIVQKRCTEQLTLDIRCELPEGKDGHAILNAQHRCRLTDLTEGAMESVVTWR